MYLTNRAIMSLYSLLSYCTIRLRPFKPEPDDAEAYN